MKRLCIISLILSVMIYLCACGKTSVDKNSEITLTFVYEDKDISAVLEGDEAEQIRTILAGHAYNSLLSGIPSCGFSENISLKVGNRIFAIACDNCNNIQDLSNLKYFDIPAEDMEYIRTLFVKYGGYFPCI